MPITVKRMALGVRYVTGKMVGVKSVPPVLMTAAEQAYKSVTWSSTADV
jgi:hypothetical protein